MFSLSEYVSELTEVSRWLSNEYSGISAGRANPALLDSVQVDVYGSRQPIKNIASITLEDARTLRVSPWDKTQSGAIERAIDDMGMPLSVVGDSNGLRVIVPMMTEENRTKIMKHVKSVHEDARVRVRTIRERANKSIDEAEKAGEFAQDDKFRFREELQKSVDLTNQKLDEIMEKKEQDIMTV